MSVEVKILSVIDVSKQSQGMFKDGKTLVFGEPYAPLFISRKTYEAEGSPSPGDMYKINDES